MDAEVFEKEPISRRSVMAMPEFSMVFEGAFSPDAVTNALLVMLTPGTQVKLKVECAVSAV